jgi:hypothetical protein
MGLAALLVSTLICVHSPAGTDDPPEGRNDIVETDESFCFHENRHPTEVMISGFHSNLA